MLFEKLNNNDFIEIKPNIFFINTDGIKECVKMNQGDKKLCEINMLYSELWPLLFIPQVNLLTSIQDDNFSFTDDRAVTSNDNNQQTFQLKMLISFLQD